MLPKISIVTISFNQGAYLEDCIRSVIDQDDVEVEYIVVDPGSTDNSRDIIARYSDRISRAILEPDTGPADGLNKGFGLSTGSVLGYINADDRLVKGSLRYVAEYFARNSHVDVITGSIRMIDETGRPSLRKRTADQFDLRRYAAGICTIGQQATFFTKRAFQRAGGFNPGNRITWDGELLVDMALSGCQFERVNKVLGDFRVYSTSLTGDRSNRQRQTEDIKRISRKISAAGVKLYEQPQLALSKVFYKLNLLRHLSYYLAK